jgi:hypothetical protein
LELRNERVERFEAMMFDKWEEDERAMRGRRRKKGNFIILVGPTIIKGILVLPHDSLVSQRSSEPSQQ